MIFVTVGTHEQQFDRLVKYMDEWAGCHDEKVIIQTGYSLYVPENCFHQKMFSYQEMEENIKNARVVITHGGPSSFLMPIQTGKIPIVVPRKRNFGEHVNNHQVRFCRQIQERQRNIILIEKIEKLDNVIKNFESISQNIVVNSHSNNLNFCVKLNRICEKMKI